MAPTLSRSAPGNIVHWWNHIKFRLQNRKGWDEMLDETFLYQSKRVNEIPLFYATKSNNVGCIKKLLDCSTTNIFERGALGETALHVAVMNDNFEAAVALMDGAPELINEPMTSELYQGITAVHIAVINQNVNLVQELVNRGADVTTPRATGEHILAFASCIGNEEIISMLIKAGANIRAQDSLGNTILHLLVQQPNKIIACQVMDILLTLDADLDPTMPLDMVANYRGLTPLKLAAKKGNVVAFQHMVNRRRILQWSLGSLSSYLYELSEIDSHMDDISVLTLIVSSQKRKARKLLELTPIQQLINLKWNLYGKYYFRLLLLVYLLYIGTFTLCCMYRPLKDIPENYTKADNDPTIKIQKTLKESYVSYADHLRLGGEIISVIGAIIILLLEIPDILRVGAKRYFGQTALGGPFHVTLVAYAVLVVTLCVVRLTELPGETGMMAVSLVLGWCNVLYFARGFEMLGPYVIVIQKIIFGDLTKFMWLSAIALLGFSTAQWTVYMTQEPLSVPAMRSYPITLFTMFELTVGLIDLPVDHTIHTHPIVFLVSCCFSVVSHLLLLSLLTAMMSDTQWRVAQERDELWRTQVVATILMLEHRLPRCLFPRLGMCGLNYGLGDRWYLRVEDRNDQFMQKIRRYVNLFAKNDDSENNEESQKIDTTNEAADTKGIQNDSLNGNRKSLLCWQIIRNSLLGLELENEENLNSQEMRPV
ncbi:transient receptor potential cation channel subfamily V member 6 isoform X2 [Silurus meridionalis]|uniref:transient receptor potential cation channel subfamily V member 6 isoform X2 n=1 Tax=Silurus meridionalis TaxID=175797 RepID=UPI001EEB6C94|nr:transient receptor potential cation channel subfamily V member 6 isoform X2 [Silurus meridionalis]